MSSIHIDSNIYTTAPCGEDRLPMEMDTYALLDRLGIGYLRLDHDATATVGRFALRWSESSASRYARTCFCATRPKRRTIC